MKKIYIIVVAIIVIGLGVYFVSVSRGSKNDTNQLACTEEAKLCSDGSSVGRTGPKCEFAACPTSDNPQTFKPLTTTYITNQDWPPVVTTIPGEFSCNSSGSEIKPEGKTNERTINGKRYCVTLRSEGAAGSTYTTYTYITPLIDTPSNNKLVQTVFTLRSVQCDNYDDLQKTACKNEQMSFSPDSIVEPGVMTSCYQYSQKATPSAPYSVNETIRITKDGNNITGTKVGNQSGPDMTNGYEGALTGTISNNMLTAIFDYVVEGSSNKEQELYEVTDFRLTKHRYPLFEKNGILIPDTSKKFTEMVYQEERCK